MESFSGEPLVEWEGPPAVLQGQKKEAYSRSTRTTPAASALHLNKLALPLASSVLRQGGSPYIIRAALHSKPSSGFSLSNTEIQVCAPMPSWMSLHMTSASRVQGIHNEEDTPWEKLTILTMSNNYNTL